MGSHSFFRGDHYLKDVSFFDAETGNPIVTEVGEMNLIFLPTIGDSIEITACFLRDSEHGESTAQNPRSERLPFVGTVAKIVKRYRLAEIANNPGGMAPNRWQLTISIYVKRDPS